MADYKEFKVEEKYNGRVFVVLVKGWFGIWKSGFISTDYFSIQYETKVDALDAIERYKNRFTLVD